MRTAGSPMIDGFDEDVHECSSSGHDASVG